MSDYLKYWTPVLVLSAAFAGFIIGGDFVWMGILTFPVLAILDSIVPRDLNAREISNRNLANIPIWICAVAPVILYFVFAWRLSVEQLSGWQTFGAVMGVAWMGVVPLVPATHELYHMRSSFARFIGRYAQVCYFDCLRDIAHVNTHHIDVATPTDGDTAARGLDLYRFTWLALTDSTKVEMRRESNALVKKGLSPWNIRHRIYRAILALAIFHVGLHLVGGWQANLFGLCAQLIARLWVESFNYFQHYGLVRVPGTAIGRRHVWNHLGWFSRTVAFDITTHADHHLNSYQPYYKLVPHQEGIMMPSVFVCFLSALIPPLWHEAIIKPALKRWDTEYATAEERVLAAKANKAAGWPDWQKDPDVQIGAAHTIGV